MVNMSRARGSLSMTMENYTEQLTDIHNEVISEFSKTLEMFALNPSESQLFVTLYLSNRPMNLDEMKEALGKSKTAMSNATRTLLDYNLIERVWRKGERKDLYKAKEDLYHKFMKTYVRRWLDAIEQQKNNLNFIENKLRGLSNSEERVFIEEKIHEAIYSTNHLKRYLNN